METFDHELVTDLVKTKSELLKCVTVQELSKSNASTPILAPHARKLASIDPNDKATNQNIERNVLDPEKLVINAAPYSSIVAVPLTTIEDAEANNFPLDTFVDENAASLIANTVDNIIISNMVQTYGVTADKVEYTTDSETTTKLEEVFGNLEENGFMADFLVVNGKHLGKLRNIKDSTGNYIFGDAGRGLAGYVLGAQVVVVDSNLMATNQLAVALDSRFMHAGIRLLEDVLAVPNANAACVDYLVRHRSGFTPLVVNNKMASCWLVDETA